MNYQNIHDQIIARAKSENRTYGRYRDNYTYYERHHIIPKCLGGDNSKENLVLLTVREHFLVHWLLAEIYQTNALWYAFNMMFTISGNQRERYIPSSRVVEYARKEFAKRRKSYITTQETRNKISNTLTGRKIAQETKDKISKNSKGKTKSKESIEKFIKTKTGMKYKPYKNKKASFTQEHIKNLVISHIGVKQSIETIKKRSDKVAKPILQYDLQGNFIKEWRSQADISKEIKVSINLVLKNIRKTAGGFLWKYKNENDDRKNSMQKNNR